MALYETIFIQDYSELQKFIKYQYSFKQYGVRLDDGDIFNDLYANFDDDNYSIKSAKAFIGKLIKDNRKQSFSVGLREDIISLNPKINKQRNSAEKQCTVCKIIKDISQFYINNGKCKKCFLLAVKGKDRTSQSIKRSNNRTDLEVVMSLKRKGFASDSKEMWMKAIAEHRKNMAETGKGRFGRKQPNRNKPILVKKDGFVMQFNNLRHAEIELNIPTQCISRCLNGKRKSSRGYTFELVNDLLRS